MDRGLNHHFMALMLVPSYGDINEFHRVGLALVAVGLMNWWDMQDVKIV